MGSLEYLPVPSNPPDTGVIHTCQFGKDWLPIVVGKLEELKHSYIFINPPDDIENQVDELISRIEMGIIVSPENFPEVFTIWHDESIQSPGVAISVVLNASQIYGFFAESASPSNGNIFLTQFYCKAGHYDLHTLGVTQNVCGKADYQIDGNTVISGQDWYTAAAVFNATKLGNVFVPTDGMHVLAIVVNGKNASSTGFRLRLTKFWGIRTGD